MDSIKEILSAYDARAPLARASTIPAVWYTDERIAALERATVFSRSWQVLGRAEQVAEAGQYITGEVARERVIAVRGRDKQLRAFFNVCRHHAAAVMTEACGTAQRLQCPYHGWTYGLDGALKGVPDFDGVEDFDREKNGLMPVNVGIWEKFVLVSLEPGGPGLADFLGDLASQIAPLNLVRLHFAGRREWELKCNWKVFVDNYLDGGYHVPYLHKGLNSILDYSSYTISNGARYCLQSSPMERAGGERATAQARSGERALYYWLYPNFMLNWYEGYLDTNLVIPLGIDRMKVIFDFYFADVSPAAQARNQQSMEVSGRIQDEDMGICESVQKGLGSRAYGAGRLSARREAGENLFHRLLHEDLSSGLAAHRTTA